MSLSSPKDFPATYATTQFRRKFSPGATEKSLATLARAHFITTTNSTDRGVTGCGARPNSTNRRGVRWHNQYAGFVFKATPLSHQTPPENTLPVGSFSKTNPPAKTLCKRYKYLVVIMIRKK